MYEDMHRNKPHKPLLKHLPAFLASPLVVLLLTLLPDAALAEVRFSEQQVSDGEAVYRQHCQACHGSNLDNGQFAPPINGFFFRRNWEGKSLGELARLTYNEMPPGGGRSLRIQDYLAALAFILDANGFEAGPEAMSSDFDELDNVIFSW